MGIAVAVVLGIVLNIAGFLSPFHSNPMFVFLMYGIPCVLGQVLAFSLMLRGKEDNTWIAGKATLAALLLTTTFFARMVFSVTYNLLFGMIGWTLARKTFTS